MTDGNLTGEVLEAAVAKTEDPAKSKPEADPGSVEAAQEVHEEADHDSLVPVTGSLVGEEEVPYLQSLFLRILRWENFYQFQPVES
jgi:hypothetical protein